MAVPAVRSPDPLDERPVARAVSCRGHAFDESLRCPCGTSWFEHQATPRRCRLEAQRCKRTAPASAAEKPAVAED